MIKIDKKWVVRVAIGVLVVAVLAVLSFIGLVYTRSMFTVVKYGTPHYRPQVE